MRERCMRPTLSLLAASAASVLLLSGTADAQQATPGDKAPEMASRGQRAMVREIKYGDWKKVCFKTPGSGAVCRTSINGTFDTGQSAVRIDLIERESESKARLQVFVPVGLYLPPGVKLAVDKGKTYQVPYAWCMTNTCIAGNPADKQLLGEMEKGGKLSVEVVDSSVQSITTEIPLGQFAAVRKGAPAQTFQQDVDE